ncbi:hypothetical protein OBBRIDRAFT_723682, partial [Obba rivulosa]
MFQDTSELPPELTDRIIDFLYGDKYTLAACGLVCRAWVPASRFHLFHSVRLRTKRQYLRWLFVLTSSRHIGHYVRKL